MKKFLQKLGRKLFGFEEMESPMLWHTVMGDNLRKDSRNGFLDANIRAIANAFCNGEIKLKNNDGEEVPYTKKGENIFLDLMYQPCRFLSFNQFRQIITAQYLIFGNVYILKNARDSKGRPSELIPVPAPAVEVIIDVNTGYPKGYKIILVGGKFLNVGLDDMVHIYEGNAFDLFRGIPRALACRIDADTLNATKEFNLSFFTNGATLGGIITLPKDGRPLRNDEKAEMLAYFNDMHKGQRKAHRTGILSGGATYADFKTSSHKDMEFIEGQKNAMQQIYSAMGVPPALLGLFEHAPQFNTKEQQRIFYETNIIPLAKLVSDAFNEHLIGDFYPDENYYLEFDFSKVEALKRDWNAEADTLLKLSQKFPLNDVKRALDLPLPDVEGGDEVPNPLMSAFGAFTAGKLNAKGLKRAARLVRPSPAKIKKHKAARVKLVNDLLPLMADIMEKHFAAQSLAVNQWYEKNADKPFNYDDIFGSLEQQKTALFAAKIPVLAQIFNTGFIEAQEYIQSVLPSKDFKFLNKKDLKDRVQQWAEQNALLWCNSIEDTTLKELDDIVKAMTAAGKSYRQINDVILQFFSREGFEPTDEITEFMEGGARHTSVFKRVETITQTETRNTLSESELEAYKSTPFVNGKGWITTLGVSDHHEGHLEMDGQEVGINDDFVNPVTGDRTQGPGLFGIADQDINCLCTTYPIVIDED